MTSKYFVYKYNHWLIASVILLCLILAVWFYRRGDDWKLFVPVIGGAVSLIYIIEKQKLEEARLFKDLFVEFNKRYDHLNDNLNRIKEIESEHLICSNDRNTLYDYFNLCGEEYLFYRYGYIYPDVWKSWVLGMKMFYDSHVIRVIWTEELNSGSYYGLDVEREISASTVVLRR